MRHAPCTARTTVAGVTNGAGLARVIIREKVCGVARAAMVSLCALGLLNKLTIEALPFIRYARGAGVCSGTRCVVTRTAHQARLGACNAVAVRGTTRVALVIATRRVVPALTNGLRARAIALVPRRARCAGRACVRRAARCVGSDRACGTLVRSVLRVLIITAAFVALRLTTVSEVPRQASRLFRAAVALVSDRTGLTSVVGCKKVS